MFPGLPRRYGATKPARESTRPAGEGQRREHRGRVSSRSAIRTGRKGSKDAAQAAAWYRKAADKGYARGTAQPGVLYEIGKGVPADASDRRAVVSKGRRTGFAPAQFSLGLCYVHGKGVPQDYKQALEWYEKAAQQKNSDALMNLAYLYHNGQGVPEDEARSFDFVRQAAEAGSPDAQFQLGMDYYGGEQGLAPDNDVARKWLHKAAEQGDVAAQFNYAMLLKAEPSQVYFWLSVATPHLPAIPRKPRRTFATRRQRICCPRSERRSMNASRPGARQWNNHSPLSHVATPPRPVA